MHAAPTPTPDVVDLDAARRRDEAAFVRLVAPHRRAAAGALLPDARLGRRRRGRAAGGDAARVAGAAGLRGAQLAALVAVPDRDERLPAHDRAAAAPRAARRPRPAERRPRRRCRRSPSTSGSSRIPTRRSPTRGPRPRRATSSARASSWPSSPRCSTCRRASARCCCCATCSASRPRRSPRRSTRRPRRSTARCSAPTPTVEERLPERSQQATLRVARRPPAARRSSQRYVRAWEDSDVDALVGAADRRRDLRDAAAARPGSAAARTIARVPRPLAAVAAAPLAARPGRAPTASSPSRPTASTPRPAFAPTRTRGRSRSTPKARSPTSPFLARVHVPARAAAQHQRRVDRWIRAAAPDLNHHDPPHHLPAATGERLGARPRERRVVHGGARHARRHHRADDDPPRPRRLDRAARVDRQRLQPQLRRPAHDRRRARRPLRAPAHVRRRPRAVRARLGGVRAGARRRLR